MMSRDKGSSWCTHGVRMYNRDEDVWYKTIEVWHQGTCRKHGGLKENTYGWVIGYEDRAWTLGLVI